MFCFSSSFDNVETIDEADEDETCVCKDEISLLLFSKVNWSVFIDFL
jgi:hypothetical protein